MPGVTDDDSAQSAERLKSTLWYHIGQLIDEETINLGTNATPQYIGSLLELVWAQIGDVAKDLESFANHAGRHTIKTEDVLLLSRRNEGLETLLRQKLKDIQTANKDKAKDRVGS